MRDILFRGQTISGEWVFGSLDLTDLNNPKIRVHDLTLSFVSKFVLPDSVGQSTTFKDEKEKLIFENDLVEFYYKGNMVVCLVIFDSKEGMFCLKWTDGYINHWKLNPESYKIIGNLTDNPDLFKAKKSKS